MASISGANNEKIFSLKKWGGLNEAPDGDTRLKLGDASEMVNWKITRDGNLKRRPGTEFVAGLNSQYSVNISGDIKKLCEIHPGDTFAIYHDVLATEIGRIELIGTGAAIQSGVMTSYTAQIQDGVLRYDTGATTIEAGVLNIQNAYDEMTLETLQEELDSLEDGEYLYLWHDELPYAINRNSIASDSSGMHLDGYLIQAVAESTAQVTGLWAGLVQGREMLLAACNGWVWSLYDVSPHTGRED